MIILQKFQRPPPIILQRRGPNREFGAVRTNNLPAIPAIIGPPGPKGADGMTGPVGPVGPAGPNYTGSNGIMIDSQNNIIADPTIARVDNQPFNPLPLIEFALNNGL